MAISCIPATLWASACTSHNLSDGQRELVKLAILCRWSVGNTSSCDIPTLLAEACANGFNWLSAFQRKVIAIVLLCQIQSAAPIVNPVLANLIGWWAMEEASGQSRQDSSGNGNTLLDSGTITQAVGKILFGAGYAGGDRKLTAVLNPSLTLAAGDSYSMAFWVYPSNTTVSNFTLFTQRSNSGLLYTFGILTDGTTITFSRSGSSGTLDIASAQGALNTFHLVIASWDAVNLIMRLRVDNGAAVTQATTGTNTILPDGKLWVGNRSSPFFTGRMDEVAFWKGRVLSTSDEAALWNGGSGRGYAA